MKKEWTREHQNRLAIKAQKGDQAAKEQLFQENESLIWDILHRKFSWVDGEIKQDLYNEGVIGFCIAIEKFKPEKDVKFTTYAAYWIPQTIENAYRNNYATTIRKPVNLHKDYTAIRRAYGYLAVKLGRTPTTKEVVNHLSKAKKKKWSVKKVENVVSAFATPTSLSLAGDPNDSNSDTLDQFLADPHANTDGTAEVTALHEELQKAIIQLTKRQRTAILMKYGLAPYKKEYEISEIAKKLHTSENIVWSTINRGLQKMAQQSQSLKRWLDSDCDPP